ncbi:MAG: aldose 1-epimerase family protein [Oscillospiraceae bacterium]|nr:aldose 1-epimerase family protein [Oscillospiraceae bacterium]
MLHTIKNEYLTVTAAEKGGELQSVLGADGIEYLWQGDPAYWGDRAPNIFPYVARLTKGMYYLDGTLHRMPIHGIAPYSTFSLVGKEERSMALELTDSEGSFGQYPRHFAFRILYTLVGNRLDVTYEVENRDKKTMYFGLGGHPGFRVPLAPGLKFEDYRLRFSAPCRPKRVGFTDDCFLNGMSTPFALAQDQFLPLRHDLFDHDAIVLKGMDRQAALETDGDCHSVTVTYPQMDYLGLWHMPRTDAPYLCIEPWTSLPSFQDQIAVLEEQKDLLSLEPGCHYSNRWSVAVGRP